MVAIIRAWRIVPCILSLAFERLIRVCFTTIFSRLFSLAPRNEKFFQFSSHSFFWVGGSKGKGKQSSRWSRKSLKSEIFELVDEQRCWRGFYTADILFCCTVYRLKFTSHTQFLFWCLMRNWPSSDWKFGWRGWRKFNFFMDWIDLSLNWIKWCLHNKLEDLSDLWW